MGVGSAIAKRIDTRTTRRRGPAGKLRNDLHIPLIEFHYQQLAFLVG